MTDAQFSTSVVGDHVVLAVRGEIDMANAADLDAALRDLVERADGHPLVLDASELAFLDSTAVKVLVRAQRRYAHGNRIEVRNASAAVRRVLEMMVPGVFDLR
jgi:anti-anti-sigma factor